MGAVLRVGRDLQPREPRGGGRARTAQAPEPAGHGCGGGDRGQPGVRSADSRARTAGRPRAAGAPPDGAAPDVDRTGRRLSTMAATVEGGEVRGPDGDRFDEALTPDALQFAAAVHRLVDPLRRGL